MIEKQEEDTMCGAEEQIVGECVEIPHEEADKGPLSDDVEDDDKFDTEGMSDSSDVVDGGKLCKKWEKYPIGHKLER